MLLAAPRVRKAERLDHSKQAWDIRHRDMGTFTIRHGGLNHHNSRKHLQRRKDRWETYVRFLRYRQHRLSFLLAMRALMARGVPEDVRRMIFEDFFFGEQFVTDEMWWAKEKGCPCPLHVICGLPTVACFFCDDIHAETEVDCLQECDGIGTCPGRNDFCAECLEFCGVCHARLCRRCSVGRCATCNELYCEYNCRNPEWLEWTVCRNCEPEVSYSEDDWTDDEL
jgi:hypothetical protein